MTAQPPTADNAPADIPADEVFAKAAESRIRTTNLGGHTCVTVRGIEYTVIIPQTYRAHIAYRASWGDVEDVYVAATPAQDRALRTAWNAAK